METGKLQNPWEPSSEATVSISLEGKSERNSSLVCRLETWACWLAAETIAQWRELPVENFSVATIAEDLGLTSVESIAPLLIALCRTATNTLLSEELILRVQALHEQLQQKKLQPHSRHRKWWEEEVAGLARWFTQLTPTTSLPSQSPTAIGSCLAQLHSNTLILRTQSRMKLREHLARLWQAGPQSVLEKLGSLSEVLQNVQANYEIQRQDCLRRESSAWQAYYTLSGKLADRNWLWSGRSTDWEAALRALAVAYKFKLEAETYTQASQLVGELVQQTRAYTAQVAQTDAMLTSLQSWFTERCAAKPIFIPLLRDYLAERANPVQLRRELEGWAGHSLNQWGIAESVQVGALREQILSRLRPLSLEIYTECCQSALTLDLLHKWQDKADDY
ncbi:MAG: hypothetical protein JO235_27545 [Chroococcidiopsidaceae cyanobacterium CP_BM_RX_35]|nr:hypothetical protein [Chroococcidiopsidaceae cyanobacterium CP_BM_RX_35]